MRKTTHYCVIANNIQVRLIEYIKLTPAIRLRADLRRVFLNVFNNKNYGTIFILPSYLHIQLLKSLKTLMQF